MTTIRMSNYGASCQYKCAKLCLFYRPDSLDIVQEIFLQFRLPQSVGEK
jgi:hypothetical protein